MSFLALFLLLVGLFSTYCQGQGDLVSRTMAVQGRLLVPDGSKLRPTTVVLNGGEHKTLSRVDGSFTFQAIPAGIYSLDVYCPHYHFPSYKLKLLDASPDAAPAPAPAAAAAAETAASITVVEYKYPGAPRIPASYPMLISALAPVQYQLPKAPFSLMGMLMGNPMMLLMVFTGIMAFVMPKMMANMSPEELEELKKQSATSGDPMAKLSKLMSGGGSGKGEPDEDD